MLIYNIQPSASPIVIFLLISHLRVSKSNNSFNCRSLFGRGGGQRPISGNQIPPLSAEELKENVEGNGSLAGKFLSSRSSHSEDLPYLNGRFSEGDFIHSIDYAEKAAALLQESGIPPPPPGLLPRSTRIEVMVRSVTSYSEYTAWKKEIYHHTDDLVFSSQISREIDVNKNALVDNMLLDSKPPESIQDIRGYSEENMFADQKEDIGLGAQLETESTALQNEETTDKINVSLNLLTELVEDESLEACTESDQPSIDKSNPFVILPGSKHQPYSHNSESENTFPDYALIDMPESPELVFQTLQPILKMQPKIKRSKRKITKKRSVPRRSILSSLEDDADHDLNDDELAILIEDLKQTFMVEVEYDAYEYDGLDPYTISQEPISIPFHNLCSPFAGKAVVEEEDTDETLEDYYENILQLSGVPDSWECPNLYQDDRERVPNATLTALTKSELSKKSQFSSKKCDWEFEGDDEDVMTENDCRILEDSESILYEVGGFRNTKFGKENSFQQLKDSMLDKATKIKGKAIGNKNETESIAKAYKRSAATEQEEKFGISRGFRSVLQSSRKDEDQKKEHNGKGGSKIDVNRIRESLSHSKLQTLSLKDMTDITEEAAICISAKRYFTSL